MEWQLPIQKVEINNIHIGNPWARGSSTAIQKPMAPLSYFGTHFRLPFITLLFPPLQIVDYNPTTGRLELDMSVSSLACIKLNTLQETLTNAILYHQQSWFKTEYTKEEVKGGFQPIIENNHIILHCPLTARGVPIYRQVPNLNTNQLIAGRAGDDMNMSNLELSARQDGALEKGTKRYNKEEGWQAFTATDMKVGQRIRVAIKIHGISFLTRPDKNGEQVWSGRCRLQHRIQGLIAQQ